MCLVIQRRYEGQEVRIKITQILFILVFIQTVFAQPALTHVEIDYQRLSRLCPQTTNCFKYIIAH